MSAATGCKLSVWGLNKIGSQNTFPSYFFLLFIFTLSCYPLNNANDIRILAFRSLYENTISLLFHEKNGFISLWGPLNSPCSSAAIPLCPIYNKTKNTCDHFTHLEIIPILVRSNLVNSLAPGKFEWNFRHVIFKQILLIGDWGLSCEIALTWKPQDLTDDKSTLVQVMALCRRAISHYLSQCWSSSLSPYGVTRPQRN